MVTPLLDYDTLDLPGLERLVDHLIRGGVHGIFILGTTGEGPSLCHLVQQKFIQAAVKQVDGRVPVLVGITDTSIVESIALAQCAADAGADAVVTSAPPYFQIAQPELLEYLGQLIEKIPLPLVLYNMPSLTKVHFETDTIGQMLDFEKVIGIKDSSGNLTYAADAIQLISSRPDWMLMTGPEEILSEALQVGALGGVCGGANMFPKLYVDLYDAHLSKDHEKVEDLHKNIIQVGQLLYSIGRHDSAIIKGIKCSLSCLGICNDYMAPPLGRFQEAERKIIQERLEQVRQLQAEGIQTVMASYQG